MIYNNYKLYKFKQNDDIDYNFNDLSYLTLISMISNLGGEE